jgi:hypothetical protein
MNLDDTLAAWTAQVSIPESAAAEIFQQITATPTPEPSGLDPRWWRQFTTQLATRIIASTKPVPWAA